MATRSERSDKGLNERHSKILKELMMRPDNKRCSDCKKRDPRWCSWNLGIFFCIRCSGIHRSLGTHISKVKSADLDTWTPEQILNMQKWGNGKANLYWEAELPPNTEPPESAIEQWIRAKYERKQFAAKGPIPDPDTITLDNVTLVSAPVTSNSVSAPKRPIPPPPKPIISTAPQPSLLDMPATTVPSNASKNSNNFFDAFQDQPIQTSNKSVDVKANILSLYSTPSPKQSVSSQSSLNMSNLSASLPPAPQNAFADFANFTIPAPSSVNQVQQLNQNISNASQINVPVKSKPENSLKQIDFSQFGKPTIESTPNSINVPKPISMPNWGEDDRSIPQNSTAKVPVNESPMKPDFGNWGNMPTAIEPPKNTKAPVNESPMKSDFGNWGNMPAAIETPKNLISTAFTSESYSKQPKSLLDFDNSFSSEIPAPTSLPAFGNPSPVISAALPINSHFQNPSPSVWDMPMNSTISEPKFNIPSIPDEIKPTQVPSSIQIEDNPWSDFQ